MNLTNNVEIELISDIAHSIGRGGGCKHVLSKIEPECSSYYCEVSETNFFERRIIDYDFSTPIQLKAQLEGMWRLQGSEYMQPFAAAVTAAAFKNRVRMYVIPKGISSYIYEF